MGMGDCHSQRTDAGGFVGGEKVIFLDFDGVLNSAEYLAGRHEDGVAIDPTRMRLLKRIVEAAGAGIVLSTSWREHWSADPEKCSDTGLRIGAIFREHGLQILDRTPQLRAGREAEILCWLERHPEVQGFVVLDDSLLNEQRLGGRFVKTSFAFGGLDEADVQKAIEILDGQGGYL